MCTRFYIDRSTPELITIGDAALINPLAMRFAHADGGAIMTSGEIRPTNIVPTIAMSKSGNRTVFPMKWGFNVPIAHKTAPKLVVNSRTETAAQKRSFSDAWAAHRCIVPSSWYFEWEHYTNPMGKPCVGEKFSIQPKGSTVTWLCGLYRIEDGLPRFVILTTAPVPELEKIHDRMPLMLPKEQTDAWIDPTVNPSDLLPYAVREVMMWK